jgi:Ca2+-binding RTX toxin-like protein
MTVSRSLFTAGEDLNFNVAFTDSDGDAASTTLPITIVATDATGYHFTGTADADAMQGSNVVDFMTGGLGKDVMTGDTGNDTFVFQSAADSSSDLALSDVITDFQVGDKIDLSAIDANTGVGGDQAFAFGGNNPNAVANSVTWSVSGGNTIVHIDNTGDTTADMQIILNGVLSLDASKFTL